MNRLQYRHTFAKRYHERTGNYCVGWALSKVAADQSEIRYPIKMNVVHTTPFTGIIDEIALRDRSKLDALTMSFGRRWPPKPLYYHGCSPGVVHRVKS